MDAPGLTVVCRGPAADGAARGLRAGRVLILRRRRPAMGYAQEGGSILAARRRRAAPGLNQKGGVLILLGPVGRLAGERQGGGRAVRPRAIDWARTRVEASAAGGSSGSLPPGDPPGIEGEEALPLQSLHERTGPVDRS